MDGAQFKVGTIFEMALIPKERAGRFLAEFPSMLDTMRELAGANEVLESAFKGELKIELQTPIWIDDNKGERTITITEPQTGDSFSMKTKIKETN